MNAGVQNLSLEHNVPVIYSFIILLMSYVDL